MPNILNNRLDELSGNPLTINNNKNRLLKLPETGAFFSANIEKKQDGVATLSAEFGGQTFRFNLKTSEITGEIGQMIDFEVLASSDKGLSVKQVLPQNASKLSLDKEVVRRMDPKELKKTMDSDEGLASRAKEMLGVTDEEVRIQQAIAKVRQELRYGFDNAGGSLINELVGAGLSLESLSIPLLNSAAAAVSEATGKEASLSPFSRMRADVAYEKFLSVEELTPDEISRIIGSDKELTPRNIYEEAHKTAENPRRGMAREGEVWNELRPSVDRLFEREEIEQNSENLDNAKMLVENDLPLTKKNLEKVSLLKNIPSLDKNSLKEFTEQRSKEFPKGFMDTDLAQVIFRKNQAETQFMMISEASVRLSQTGLDIDASAVFSTLSDLRSQEISIKERYEISYRIAGANAGEGDIPLLESVIERAASVKPAYSTFAELTQNRIPFSLEGIDKSRLRADPEKLRDYETFSAEVSAKYGDSFNKISGQFTELLETLEIEVTEDNLRAAKILSLNQMDVNEENITEIRLFDMKIKEAQSLLHPVLAAKLLLSGKNPLDMNIDELLAELDDYAAERMSVPREDIPAAIYEMDKSGDYSNEQREGIMAVYQMLHRVSENPAAVKLALSLSGNAEPTMKNLLEASENFAPGKRRSVSQSISDDSEYTVREEFYQRIIARIDRAANPAAMKRVIGGYEDKQAVQFADELEEANISTESETTRNATTRAAEFIENFGRTPTGVILYAMENQIPLTLGNIKTIRSFLGSGDYFAGELDEAAETVANLSEFEEGQDIPEVIREMSNLLYDEETVSDYAGAEKIEAVRKTLDIQEQLYRAGKPFSLPVSYNGRVSDLNLYVQNVSGENQKNIHLSLKTEKFGFVSADIELDGEHMEVRFSSSDGRRADEMLNGGEINSSESLDKITLHNAKDLSDTTIMAVSRVVSYIGALEGR